MDTRERCVPMYVRSHVHMVVHGPHSHSVRGTSMLTRTQAHARTHALVLQPSSRATVQTLVPLAALYRALYELQTDVTSAGYSTAPAATAEPQPCTAGGRFRRGSPSA